MHTSLRTPPRDAGFTLIELFITLLVLAAVTLAISVVLFAASHSKSTTTSLIEASQGSRVALDMMSRDIRSAGYGADQNYPGGGQPSIAYVDSMEIVLSENLAPFPDTATVAAQRAPLAYDPAANPKPYPLTLTGYIPPAQFRTGAELVRYTLDLNNDGQVNANDLATPAGADAQATPDPADYVLVRQVYGQVSAGNNGGSMQSVALVRKPGPGVPAVFTVYLRGNSTPWNWANGAVPQAQLANIERVAVQVTASSGRADGQGRILTSTVREEINSLRNTPDMGQPTSVLDGYVYNDANHNGAFDTGLESGLANAAVRAGPTYVAYTSPTGYYQLHVPAGTYDVSHSPPLGYTTATPTTSVTLPPAASVSFADNARAGGWITAHAWLDTDGNGSQGAGEQNASAIAVNLSPGSSTVYTDANGNATLFAAPGAYSVGVTLPDSMLASTLNPVTGAMSDGGTASVSFGLLPALTGQVTGKVYRDNNRNTVYETGEPGIQNVWVGVTKDGINVNGYAYTDANGDYTIRVPVNDPPHTQQYYVYTVPPPGYYPTSTTAISAVWVQANAVVSGKNFGMAGYQIITLNASRVLSLASADLIEKDWNGNQTDKAKMDVDLVLGADAAGSDNVSVWFNDYDSTPLFNPNPDYTRLAPQSVMALGVDTLDTGSSSTRPDVVTGTKKAGNGNFFVWLTQNSSGNLGFLPASFSPGLNYTTNDAGDVQAVVTADVAGGSMPDIVVGTKSPTSGRGTLEVWTNSNASPPTFARDETYPSAGSIPGNNMGEVTAMALADFDGDGIAKDIVVGTRTGSYTGELLFFRFTSKANGNRYVCKAVCTLSSDFVTSLAVCDPNGDGRPDVVVGTQSATNRGHLQQWQNNGSWSFSKIREVNAQGIVQALKAADLGGGAASDIVVGWRQNDTSYGGGVEVYYMDLGVLPSAGVDISGGSVSNMVPAATTANLNYGTNPIAPTPYLTDVAVGVKTGLTTGALVLFIR